MEATTANHACDGKQGITKNTMDAAFQEKFETLAWERLRATADDDEKWLFLFTDGSVSLSYCPWAEMDDYEFDSSVHGLELPLY